LRAGGRRRQFSGLDPVNARVVINLMKELASKGKSVLLSTHQMAQVETLCERIFMINKGRQVLYGHLDEIKAQYSDNSVIVQSDADYTRCEMIQTSQAHDGAMKVYLKGGFTPGDFLTWLVDSGARVEAFARAETPLEDIFIKVVEEHR